MPIILQLLAIICIISATSAHASDDLMDAGRAATMDLILDSAVRTNLIAGGVVIVGNRDGILYSTARGQIPHQPTPIPISDRTIFDVASLTKVIATTPAIMKLLDEGRISLMDPITKWFPELAGSGLEEVTILNLLTHTSGLDDIALAQDDPLKKALQKIIGQKSWKIPGNRFRYADINFILLGELVRRVSGIPLNRFCQEHFYGPLGMGDTMFLPPPDIVGMIAPTIGSNSELSSGMVQDENARRMGGVSGHAGLFSSSSDLSRFAVMLLKRGHQGSGRIFSDRVFAQMTAPYFYSNGAVIRGLGWDIQSPFSAPRGSRFSEMSYGHTGYSGTSIWIDPERDLFVILLTVRLNYRNIAIFNRLRTNISTIALAVFSHPREENILLGDSRTNKRLIP